MIHKLAYWILTLLLVIFCFVIFDSRQYPVPSVFQNSQLFTQQFWGSVGFRTALNPAYYYYDGKDLLERYQKNRQWEFNAANNRLNLPDEMGFIPKYDWLYKLIPWIVFNSIFVFLWLRKVLFVWYFYFFSIIISPVFAYFYNRIYFEYHYNQFLKTDPQAYASLVNSAVIFAAIYLPILLTLLLLAKKHFVQQKKL